MIELNIPYPPSGNHMWKHTRNGHHYLTDKARAYYEQVAYLVRGQIPEMCMTERLEVTCSLCPPDKRRRDMDNAWKVISDSLTKANVWADDSQIRKLTIQWLEPKTGGAVHVAIDRIDAKIRTQ